MNAGNGGRAWQTNCPLVNCQRPYDRIVFFNRNHVERRVANLKAGRTQISGGLNVTPRFGSGETKIHDIYVA